MSRNNLTPDELTPDELADLLGAYALDAVEPWEAHQIAAHLDGDPAARAEVQQHRQTLAVLGAAAAEEPAPPAGLWSSITAGLAPAPPPLRLMPATAARRAPRVTSWVGGLAAAAVIVAVALFGAAVLWPDDPSLADLAAAAATAPGAEVLPLSDPAAPGAVAAAVTLLPDGVGYVDHSLPALPAGRTYQLWAVVGDQVISAAVLGPEAAVAPFRVAGDVAAFAITTEAAGGVAVSANDPVAVWRRGP